ncbi:MAG: DUF2252 domain-containing protein [Acidimicrobiales bacterium]
MSASAALPTLDERLSAGQALRERFPRSTLGALAPRPSGYDAVGRLMWQGQSRVADLLPIRYQRMLENPLSFYRGGALLMADDLARGSNTTLELQICGDAHLSNFGVFSSPEGQLVFDVNDFDETDTGPFEWDVKRLVASFAIASSYLGHDDEQQARIATQVASEYRLSMQRFAAETRLGVWYARLDVGEVVKDLRGFLADHATQRVDVVIAGAKGQDAAKSYEKLVTYEDGAVRIRAHPPLVTPLGELEPSTLSAHEVLDEVLDGYRQTLSVDRRVLLEQFVAVDAAQKVVGVGSVGTQCYIVLLVGRDQRDPFFLQVKEAQRSAVSTARATDPEGPPGERVVDGQRKMQATPDAFLGWYSMGAGDESRSFYVRQLYDNKASVIVEKLDEPLLVAYGRACSWVLARAHARSGLSAQIAGYLGKNDSFESAMTSFALAYRARNQADFEALASAAKQGRITVAT